MITYKDAEKLLAKYSDEYCKSPFVPFPSVDAAVEAITETASWIYSTEGDEIVIEVACRLKEWVDMRRQRGFWATPESPMVIDNP